MTAEQKVSLEKSRRALEIMKANVSVLEQEITVIIIQFYVWLNMSKFLKWSPARSKVCKIITKQYILLFSL